MMSWMFPDAELLSNCIADGGEVLNGSLVAPRLTPTCEP